MADQIQLEIATHAVSTKPNTPDALDGWNKDANLLSEMKAAVETLAAALPPSRR